MIEYDKLREEYERRNNELDEERRRVKELEGREKSRLANDKEEARQPEYGD